MVDAMTPRERWTAWRRREAHDRVPCGINIEGKAALLEGLGPQDFPLTPRQVLVTQRLAHERYGQELATAGFNLPGELEQSLFAKLPATRDRKRPVLAEPEDLDLLETLDPARSPGFQACRDALELLLEDLGNTLVVQTFLSGPLTLAARLRGTEALMRDIKYRPEFVHRCLDRLVEIELPFVRALGDLDVTISLMDPVSSGSLIGPAAYRQFSLPAVQRLTAAINASSPNPPNLHICGNIRNILEPVAESGAGLIMNIDECVDLSLVKEKIGHKVAFSGNIRSVEDVLLGTPASIEANVKALFSAVRTLGTFPLNLGEAPYAL